MATPIDLLLTAWTGCVLQECRGREYVTLAEARAWVDALLIGCEALFTAQDMTWLHATAHRLLAEAQRQSGSLH